MLNMSLWEPIETSFFMAASVAPMHSLVVTAHRIPEDHVVRVRMSYTVRADPLHQALVIPPMGREAPHVVIGWIVDHARLTPALHRTVHESYSLASACDEGVASGHVLLGGYSVRAVYLSYLSHHTSLSIGGGSEISSPSGPKILPGVQSQPSTCPGPE